MSSFFYTDSGQGFPLLFLHGFCESHDLWSEFTIPFQQAFRVLTPDLPGFGESELSDENITIDRVAQSIIAWLDQLKIPHVILIGHSLGGYIALSVVAQRPDLAKGLVLFHSSSYADDPEKKKHRNKVIEFIKKRGAAPYIKTYLPGLFKERHHPSLAKLYKIALAAPADVLIKYQEAMRDRPSQKDTLLHFPHPVLFIAGANDEIIPFTRLKEQSELAQVPFFHLLEESGHMGMLEEPSISQEILLKYLLFTLKTGP